MNFKSTFLYHFEWVNQGEWRTTSSYQQAIDEAIHAAHRADVGRDGSWQIHEVHIHRTRCREAHVDLCDHFDVELVFGEYMR